MNTEHKMPQAQTGTQNKPEGAQGAQNTQGTQGTQGNVQSQQGAAEGGTGGPPLSTGDANNADGTDLQAQLKAQQTKNAQQEAELARLRQAQAQREAEEEEARKAELSELQKAQEAREEAEKKAAELEQRVAEREAKDALWAAALEGGVQAARKPLFDRVASIEGVTKGEDGKYLGLEASIEEVKAVAPELFVEAPAGSSTASKQTSSTKNSGKPQSQSATQEGSKTLQQRVQEKKKQTRL